MRHGMRIFVFACVGFLGPACGRFGFEGSRLTPFDAGMRPDLGQRLFYDDAGRLIDTDAAVPDGQIALGTAVNATTSGNAASGAGIELDVSNAGAVVAFASRASNLVDGDTNDVTDLFFFEAATNTITRVQLASQEPNGASGELAAGVSNGEGVFDGETSAGPSLNQDGTRVAFASTASNWVSEDSNGLADVFVFERATRTASRASVSSSGSQASGASWAPALAGQARILAFVSNAKDLVEDDTNDVDDIFVRDLEANTTVRITREDGVQLDAPSRQPTISDDGELVAFVTEATNVNLGITQNSLAKVVVWERSTGRLAVVSKNAAGDLADRSAAFPRISGDGRYVVFLSSATNLGPDGNGLLDVYRVELATSEMLCASVDRDGVTTSAFRSSVDVSGDGNRIVFGSLSGSIVDHDYNGVGDIFLRDMTSEETRIVSVTPDLRVANDLSRPRAISPDGTAIAFVSAASDFIAGDDNGVADVIVVRGLP